MERKKDKIIKFMVSCLGILVGAFIMAFSMHVFTIPAKFAPGGIGGVASLLQIVFGFQAGYTLLLLNFPLVVLAFIFLSKEFALKTTFSILLISAFLQLFNHFNMFEYRDQSALVVSAVAGGALYGIGIALSIRVGSCSGGTDIISLLIQKKHNSLSVSWLIFYINLGIIAFGGILFLTVSKMDLTSVISILMYSLFQIFLTSKSMEVGLNGVNSAVKFEVVTTKAQELRLRILEELRRGVTIIDSRGGFSDSPNNILVCIVKKYQITPFRKILKEIDPKAFAYAVDTREVLGNGFEKDMVNLHKTTFNSTYKAKTSNTIEREKIVKTKITKKKH